MSVNLQAAQKMTIRLLNADDYINMGSPSHRQVVIILQGEAKISRDDDAQHPVKKLKKHRTR